MKPILAYDTPKPPRRPIRNYPAIVALSLIAQCATFFFAAAIVLPKGNHELRVAFFVWLVYIFTAIILIVRRFNNFSSLEIAFFIIGFPAMYLMLDFIIHLLTS